MITGFLVFIALAVGFTAGMAVNQRLNEDALRELVEDGTITVNRRPGRDRRS